ncbi:MAG: hypothetical protein HOJ35_07170 [Bdellovibrionales bacterium]|jgi:16S rRNA (cytidine1402-2'-O)-methyltransferase|nr:hypothetical protein [Bdellovibrionales bacterium]
MTGKLTLIPTPIGDILELSLEAKRVMELACANFENSIFLVEDMKPGRRRWIKFGLPRELINSLQTLNEHSRESENKTLIESIKNGKNVFLMSDAGLPAFCDPGQVLIDQCHKNKIQVTSTPLDNSIVLALALSGFKHTRFNFHGFFPRKTPERIKAIEKFLSESITSICMDTPYRLAKLLNEIQTSERKLKISKEYFLAMDLSKETELLIRGNINKIIKLLPQNKKFEFILISNS